MDGACVTLRHATPELRSGEREHVAKNPEQWHIAGYIDVAYLAVDSQWGHIGKVLFSALRLATRLANLCGRSRSSAMPRRNPDRRREDGRSAKKPVTVVDLEYNETRFEHDDMRNHRIVLRVRVLGDVEILLNLSSWIG